MNRFTRPLGGVFLAVFSVLLGCGGSSSKSSPIDPSENSLRTADRWMATQPFKDQADNAIQIRRTIQPSRFNEGTAQLNRLGTRELRVLAARYRSSPGLLSVARGDAEESLYSLRVKAVMADLAHNGVDTARMTIEDVPPGGPGVTSVDVIRIVEKGRTEKLRPERGEVLEQTGGSEPVE